MRIKKQTSSKILDKINLQKDSINSLGIFAKEKIGRNKTIIIFGGKIYNYLEINKMPKNSHIKNTASQISQNYYIGPLNEKDMEWSHFINHACNPNTYIKNGIFLQTIKIIKPGEEITLDYNHAHDKLLNFKCTCNSKNCRKFIKNTQGKNPLYRTLNKKYLAEWI